MNKILNWNYGNPPNEGNYICDLGVFGVTLGWWNGEDWKVMWSDKKLDKVYGWIEVPKHLVRNDMAHKFKI